MKNYLKIQSVGEIENGAFTLIGASTKRNDETKIGFYGSGLKYSISSLIRNNISFKIFSGEREINIETKRHDFRKDSFEVICVDGDKTSLTTNMGGDDWDNPFAPIREIYSNALDEDEDATLSSSFDLKGEIGKTTFYIEMTMDVTHFYKNINMYFCTQNENVLASNEYGSIYNSIDGDLRLFRKGILCRHDVRLKSLFNYNSPNFTINESRVISSNWIGQYYVSHIWKSVRNQDLILQLIKGMEGGNKGYFEHQIDWSSPISFSSEWGEVCSKLKFVPAELLMFAEESDLVGRIILPKSILIELYKQFNNLDILGLSPESKEPTFIIKKNPSTILVNKVIDALIILEKTNYKWRIKDGLNIEYVNFMSETTLAQAEKGVIYLSTKLDSHDVNSIAKIIIEENEHNITGYGDKTRNFQNHLFNLLFEELTTNKEN